MADIKIKIEGLDKIQAHFHKMPIAITKGLDEAVGKTGITIQAAAMKEAPVNKGQGGGKGGRGGNLRQSITFKKLGIASGVVEVGSEYGVYVHEGTRPHVIEVKNKKILANKRTGQLFGRRVNHPGTKANPFMQRAVEGSQNDINDLFGKIIRDIIKL